MKTLLWVTITVSIVCGAAASVGAGVAVAAAPQRILTATEYTQLTASQAVTKKAFGSKAINWNRARAACAVIGDSTALLKGERLLCLNGVVIVKALTVSSPQEQKCLALLNGTTTTTTPTTTTGTTTTGTSTTGTTITGTSTTISGTTTNTESTAAQGLICLTPLYVTLRGEAIKTYASDVAVRKLSEQRGFAGLCLNTLAATTTQLRKEKAFVDATKKFADDLVLFTKVASGEAPSSVLDGTNLSAAAEAFTRAVGTYLSASGPSKLSVCPHQ
jgi:hypothetical protein